MSQLPMQTGLLPRRVEFRPHSGLRRPRRHDVREVSKRYHVSPPLLCAAAQESATTGSEKDNTLLSLHLPPAKLASLVAGTQLANCELGMLYNSSEHGWSSQSFFDANFLFDGGVPTLLVGRTITGTVFGGVNSVGFDRRDDYRDSVTCVLFVLSENNELLISRPATRQGSTAIMDFEDCAVSFGPVDLRIPMNKDKHLISPDCATSSLGASYELLPNGQSSLFGDNSRETLEQLETYANLKFINEAMEQTNRETPSFSGLFSSFVQSIVGKDEDDI